MTPLWSPDRVAIISKMADVLPAHADRVDAFRRHAELRASGEVVAPPDLLGPRERRLHLRNTLVEDHAVRLVDRPDAVAGKFALLAASTFSFFRGTALLYYRDHAGVDGHLPAVFCIGDVHPENFGVMPSAAGHPVFGPNDFDEAWIAPFTYDVHRGAVGFWMAALERDAGKKARRRLVAAFVQGYLDGLVAFAADDSEDTLQVTADTAPPVLAAAFAKAGRSRSSFLAKRIDLDAHRFLADERIEPRNELASGIQPVVDAYAATLDLGPGRPDGFFRVHDVALRHGGGTASQGLARFWALLDGWGPDATDDVIIELKAARRSALYGLVPATDFDVRTSAERIALAHSEFLVDGDALYGAAEIEGRSFLVRERSPMKVNVSVAAFDDDELLAYADVCGRALAQTHARSESHVVGVEDGPEAEVGILRVVNPTVFVADAVEFAEEAAARVVADHALFCEDVERGAFDAPGSALAADDEP